MARSIRPSRRHFAAVRERPLPRRPDRFEQGLAQRGESVELQAPQGFGEHLRPDAADPRAVGACRARGADQRARAGLLEATAALVIGLWRGGADAQAILPPLAYAQGG
ncbi:hypothetical protein JOM49_006675 [Amycolatopsis magusensis]|uniref:Uncharacterized protein n=1 Tax=Amycolatopsis magusensis TaxID=882444 RepID=A0ABS4Q0F5_9PSEU|nr:hypothetical protein [Amycolatopsis magusensis]